MGSWHITSARDLLQMDSIDQQLSAKIALINEHKRRRDMLMSFSKAPADFINGIVASQVSDARGRGYVRVLANLLRTGGMF